jgi:rSAM/selenodomain-associated transferase 2
MISIIIPTLNAADLLPACLERLNDADEIVVADGGSADGTSALAQAAGARVLDSPLGRGRQLAAGAAAATGDWLLFLHADTLLDPGWRTAVDAHVAAGGGGPACFRFALADPAWQARLIERGVALRNRLLGLPFGDQGLLVSRSCYRAAGGYRPLPLMEDVDLVRRLGRGHIRLLPAAARTSAIRWRRDGWGRRSLRNLACLALYACGASPQRLNRLYG